MAVVFDGMMVAVMGLTLKCYFLKRRVVAIVILPVGNLTMELSISILDLKCEDLVRLISYSKQTLLRVICLESILQGRNGNYYQ